MYKSIKGGSKFITESYIKYGQTTVYYQKYNVVNKNNLYGNQYMTNVWGAYSEGRIMRSKYIKYGILESNFTFNIPLYVGMPAMNGELVYINVDSSLILRAKPSASSNSLLSLNPSSVAVVLRVEKAGKNVDGYYWDKVITPRGIGYMARNAKDDSKQFLVPLSLVAPGNIININENNAFAEPDSNNNIITEPNTTVNKLKETYKDAIIVDKSGNEITGETLVGTGSKIKINGEEKYTIIKLGDVNGDGKIKASDYVLIKNYIMTPEKSNLNEIQKIGADINKDKNIKASDYVLIKNYIMSGTQIKL